MLRTPCARVRAPGHDDWKKLVQLVKFMAATKDDVLTLSMGEMSALHSWVDASFAVHPDCKSHGTGLNFERQKRSNSVWIREAEVKHR